MSTNSNFDRITEAWLAEGPAQLADRVLDAALDEVHLTRQRRRLPVLWRINPMPVPARLAVAAVIGVLLVGTIYLNLPGRGTTGTSSPTPSPTPTATPTGTPVATGPIALPEGTLTGGRYILRPQDDPSTLRIVADVPAGWQGFPPALTSPGQRGGILIGFMATDGLFSDPCHWDLNGTGLDNTGDVVVGPTVDELVTALQANTSYTSSVATPITFGEFEGQELELQLPGDDVLSTCDEHGEGSPFTGTAYFVFPGGFYAQGPNSRWHLYILDVDGNRLITMISIEEGASQAQIAAAEAIVESFEITP